MYMYIPISFLGAPHKTLSSRAAFSLCRPVEMNEACCGLEYNVCRQLLSKKLKNGCLGRVQASEAEYFMYV